MEAGNREEEDRYFGATLPTRNPDSQPASPTRLSLPTPSQHQHRQQYYYPYYQHQHPHPTDTDTDPLDSADLDSIAAFDYHHPLLSSQFVAYASNNFEAANANAATCIEPVGLVDPDDFYRTYNHEDGFQLDQLMASTLPVSRQNRDASLRPNGNSSPKNPTSPSARNGLRPAVRSVSAPVDDKISPGPTKSRPTEGTTTGSGARSGHQPSVKDLKKRFDLSTTQSSSTSRKTTPRIPTRETSSASGHRGVGSPPSTNGQSYAALRSSVTRDLPSASGASSTTRSTQRNRSVPEDQLSSNAQSFASRIAKPRVSVGSQGQASKSMTNLSPTSSPGSVPPVPQSRGLLFGEIIPGEIDTGLAGYGIESLRARRTSEPDIERPAARRQRSLSHADAEPPSPSDWYRGTNGEPPARNNTDAVRSKPHRGHSRSRSDLAGSKPNPPLSKTTQVSRPRPTLDMSALSSSSRLPVKVGKLSSPSGSSSPASTRPNSPAARKRHPAQGKLAKTTPSARAKTPTHSSSATSRRPNKLGTATPNNNTRLNAYISAPLPKLSPPLRSSRPRQPVSAATTTSSRMRTVERGRSPLKYDSKPGTKHNESARRRKISMGPIDFESRREQIKLSYTKSIRETEVRAAVRKAAEEKRKKAEDAAKAEYAAAEALKRREEKLREELASDSTHSPADAEASPLQSPALRTITTGLVTESPADGEAPAAEQPSMPTIMTGLLRQATPCVAMEEEAKLKDSPTLGIPGSFPNARSPEDQEEAPPSAVSNTTEFDAEPQTEPPVQEIPVREDVSTTVNLDEYFQPPQPQSDYRSPFDDTLPNNESESIKISLDASTEAGPIQSMGPTEQSADLDAGHETHASYKDDEYEPPLPPQTYQTKVTIVGRNSDFSPSSREFNDVSTFVDPSQSRVPEESNNQPTLPALSSELACSDEASLKDELAASGADISEIEEFLVGPMLKDSAALSRASTTKPEESSDETANSSQHATEEPRFSMESRRTIGTRPSLTVPRTSYSMNRTSQATIWTDYSVSSQDAYSKFASRDLDFEYRNSTHHDDHAVSEPDSRSQSFQYERRSRDTTSSREVSPRGTSRDFEVLHEQHHQLPEIDTGEGFVVDYISRKNSSTFSSVPVVPNRSPPPPPDEISFRDVSSATPSEYIDETRPSSYVHAGQDDQSLFSIDPSRRESDDFPQYGSTTRSIDQTSFENSEGLQSSSSRLASQQTLAESFDRAPGGLSDKERKRLFTRLETIKELIDTEAFFIRDMNIVEEIYKGTAEACPRLDDNTIKLIFRNTDQIIKFHSGFLKELKEGVSSVYTPKSHRTNLPKSDTPSLNDGTASVASSPATATGHLSDDRDRETSLGPIFTRNMEKMKAAHETFLKNSDHAAKRLIQIQEDPTVQVWLNECNEVARDLTKAWNLDSLLIKPMQRITKYPNLLIQLLHETPADHPDRPSLESAKGSLEDAIEEINKTKKNFELVGQIVGRKRKESDVKAGFARAFGKRVDKLQATNNRPAEDPEYLKLHEKFGDDYLRLQVVLRDVEFYTRQVTEYVHEFLQYLSSMELVMRLQPSPHPEIESKWVRFNVSMRDIEKVALEQHLSQVRKQVIEPFELVIKSYGNPSLAMKKRAKRRLDYEKSIQLKKSGKKVDKQLTEFIEQYEALNEALKKELPKLSGLTEKVGNICLGNFVNIQAEWFSIWKEKVKVVLEDSEVPEISDIITTFQRDFKFQDEQMNTIGIVNPVSRGRPSQSASVDEASGRLRLRPADLDSRGRGLSLNSDVAPSLPTPDFMKRHSGQFTVSPSAASVPSPHQYYYRDFYAGINGQARPGPSSPNTAEFSVGSRSLAAPSIRPGTGQSHDSSGAPRQSIETGSQSRPYSNSTHQSSYQSSDNHRFSGLFQSALPPSEGQERLPRPSQASSRASSRERKPINGYNVLWLAASLFEFNIETTKHEAGYPYLTYQAGEIFDVIAEKGELWLAKNQDDPNSEVGWLWSKHFARLADD
ncbi:hypothetical protein F5X99DRAFT_336267 [Biscogniauxia marginata]|nr:hypothetical protein F5X99DRAFT_336267 [Biscogniauxia marginata]